MVILSNKQVRVDIGGRKVCVPQQVSRTNIDESFDDEITPHACDASIDYKWTDKRGWK